jgi:hypothetical protein
MTAAAAHHRRRSSSAESHEEQPLGLFGAPAGAAVARLLDERGATLRTASIGVPGRSGWLHISPGERWLPVDRIVTHPHLAGPRLRGVPRVTITTSLVRQARRRMSARARARRPDGRRAVVTDEHRPSWRARRRSASERALDVPRPGCRGVAGGKRPLAHLVDGWPRRRFLLVHGPRGRFQLGRALFGHADQSRSTPTCRARGRRSPSSHFQPRWRQAAESGTTPILHAKLAVLVVSSVLVVGWASS